MEFLFAQYEKLPEVNCIIIPLNKTLKLSKLGTYVDQLLQGELTTILKTGDFEGTVAQCWLLPATTKLKNTRVLLVGTGDKDKLTPNQYKQCIQAAAQAFRNTTKIKTVLNGLIEVNLAKQQDIYWKVGQIVTHTQAVSYKFSTVKRKIADAKPAYPVTKFYIPGEKTEAKAIEHHIKTFTAITQGLDLTRELANTPANICTPTHLANAAVALGKKYSSLKVTVLDERAIKKLNMGAFLAVSQGSSQPPKLISIEYRPDTKSAAKQKSVSVALVGKGITFDSGGISIKPSHDMDQMKYDMCGAASVLGVMHAIAELKLPISVVGIIPTCENLPDGNAIKPGDVVTSMSGQTIEILNTDAEGRLILCDALTYAQQKYNPKFIIDIATLTGAIIVALGDLITGLFTKDDELAKALCKAGEQSFDRVWRMPLVDEYQEMLDSNFADVANVGNRSAGSITAGLFLERFVKDQRWAHLDIAGVAWLSGKDKGATGRPVSLLTQFLLNLVASEAKKEAA